MGKIRVRAVVAVILAVVFCSLPICMDGMNTVAYAGNIDNSGYVYLGGTPLGITLGFDGVVVDETTEVMGKNGRVRPADIGGIRAGDIITMIGDTEVQNAQDIATVLANANGAVNIRVKRQGKEMIFAVVPEFDVLYGAKKLGLKVKDELAGVGTLTFVTADEEKHFGALGHMIFEPLSGAGEEFRFGYVHSCNILGVVKGVEGAPGELRGTFERCGTQIGNLEKNNFSGVFGSAEAIMYDGRPLIAVGSRTAVAPGKAYIYTTLEGNTPEKYEIEIVKAEKQNSPKDHSMVIHVVDKNLLEKTGGIVQGMSGSPIVQNGKLIGAITHVFVNDPTRGYGIYLDWMLESAAWSYAYGEVA